MLHGLVDRPPGLVANAGPFERRLPSADADLPVVAAGLLEMACRRDVHVLELIDRRLPLDRPGRRHPRLEGELEIDLCRGAVPLAGLGQARRRRVREHQRDVLAPDAPLRERLVRIEVDARDRRAAGVGDRLLREHGCDRALGHEDADRPVGALLDRPVVDARDAAEAARRVEEVEGQALAPPCAPAVLVWALVAWFDHAPDSFRARATASTTRSTIASVAVRPIRPTRIVLPASGARPPEIWMPSFSTNGTMSLASSAYAATIMFAWTSAPATGSSPIDARPSRQRCARAARCATHFSNPTPKIRLSEDSSDSTNGDGIVTGCGCHGQFSRYQSQRFRSRYHDAGRCDRSSTRARPRVPSARIPRPGGDSIPFCVDDTRQSIPHPSTSHSSPPTDAMPSTMISAPASCAARAISSIGWRTPVDVSTCVTKIPAASFEAAASPSSPGSAASPNGTSTSTTSKPFASATSCSRSPKNPVRATTTVWPGSNRFIAAASRHAVPVPA